SIGHRKLAAFYSRVHADGCKVACPVRRIVCKPYSIMTAESVRLFKSFLWQPRLPLARRLGEVCLILMICLSVTVPPITSPGSELWLKVEQVLLPLVIGVYGWMLLAGWARLIRLNALFVIASIYCICIAISMW